MAETGARLDPLAGFRFRVELDDLPAGAFAEVRGLELELEHKDYNEGGRSEGPLHFFTRAKPAALTFKRGIVDPLVWRWCFEVASGRIRYRGGAVHVQDAEGKDAVGWRFVRGLPTKWTGPELDAGQSQVAMETLELQHEGLSMLP